MTPENSLYLNKPEPAVPNRRGIKDTNSSTRVMACLTECNMITLMGHLIMKCKEL